jgi:serine O-acetyltransferase
MTKKLAEILDELVDSFHKYGGINHLDGANLPSREAVVEIARDLLRLMFPGFYDKDQIHSNQLIEYTNELVASVARRLENEIHRSLEYRPCDGCDVNDLPGTAARVTQQFLSDLPGVRAILQTDVTAAYEGDPAAISNEEIILAYPGVEAMAVQRLAHLLYRHHVALIPRIMTEWIHKKTGIDIHPGAEIGPHFFIEHCTGVGIGENDVISKEVKDYDENAPAVLPSTILGDVTIGKGSIIGGNVWLLESVPPNTVVYSEAGQTRMKTAGADRDKMIGHSHGAGI